MVKYVLITWNSHRNEEIIETIKYKFSPSPLFLSNLKVFERYGQNTTDIRDIYFSNFHASFVVFFKGKKSSIRVASSGNEERKKKKKNRKL